MYIKYRINIYTLVKRSREFALILILGGVTKNCESGSQFTAHARALSPLSVCTLKSDRTSVQPPTPPGWNLDQGGLCSASVTPLWSSHMERSTPALRLRQRYGSIDRIIIDLRLVSRQRC